MEAGVHVAIEPRHPVDAHRAGVRHRAEKGLVKRPLVSASAVGPGTVHRRPFTQRRGSHPAQSHAHADSDEQPDAEHILSAVIFPGSVAKPTNTIETAQLAILGSTLGGRVTNGRGSPPRGTRLCQPEATTKFRVQVDPFLPGGSMAERLMQCGLDDLCRWADERACEATSCRCGTGGLKDMRSRLSLEDWKPPEPSPYGSNTHRPGKGGGMGYWRAFGRFSTLLRPRSRGGLVLLGRRVRFVSNSSFTTLS